jgi:hypothetical protein
VANAKHFSIDLTRWGVSLEKEQAPKFIRKIALDLLRKVTMKSPVDTGRFRANWMVGIGGADETTTDSTVNDAMMRGAIILSAYRDLKQIHLSNNLSYAAELEHGRSMQAPLGVAEISVEEIEAHFNGGAA